MPAPGLPAAGQPDQPLAVDPLGVGQAGRPRLRPEPAQGGDRIPAAAAAAAAELAIDLDEGVAELAAGAGKTALQMAVEIEGAAEHLAGVDHGEVADAASLAEPAIADEEGARMMVEEDGQGEPLLELAAEP